MLHDVPLTTIGGVFSWDGCDEMCHNQGKFLYCQGEVRMIGWGHGRIATDNDATAAANPGRRERCAAGANTTARAGANATACASTGTAACTCRAGFVADNGIR